MTGPTAPAPPRTWVARARRNAARAVRRPGWERDDLTMHAKAVLAAVAAWSIASWLLPVSVTTFAPFTSLLSVHGTVYRSLWQSLRYMGAVAVGVVLAAGFGSTAGIHAWSLAVLLIAALAVARLRPLGAQRLQVPVTALFAFSAGGGQLDYSLQLVAAILIGVGCGLATAVLWAPRLRHGSADEAVRSLGGEVCGLLSDIADDLRETTPDETRAQEWLDRARRIDGLAQRARASVEDGEEAARLNPRRLVRGGHLRLPAHHAAVNVLERVGHQTQSIARGLRYAAHSDHYQALARDFLTGYAELLTDVAVAARELPVSEDADADGEALRDRVDRARRCHDRLAARSRRAHLDAPGEWPLYGALLTDAARILDDLGTHRPTGTGAAGPAAAGRGQLTRRCGARPPGRRRTRRRGPGRGRSS
ncbi:aromatic acid exporter family protein [Streptomyces marincola]|uniref:aromatic acid exporter family protein n=1 Tax=Streptomyces marincola TaxID=2878388 RepID=UPI001CF13266|nr:aromatic acid exporter family protein [Streptomyces marincola]UCM89948.1 aromatic acid exporter family protein [Streptomyces marincola]